MANLITLARIALAAALLFCRPLSGPFYAIFFAAGLTDVLDGVIARRTNTESDLGAKLDSLADFLLVLACAIKLIPVVSVPVWIYVWIGAIAAIRAANAVSGLVIRKKPVFLHTVMNRITGCLLFAFPFTVPLVPLEYTAPVVCAVATFAAIREGYFIRTGRTE